MAGIYIYIPVKVIPDDTKTETEVSDTPLPKEELIPGNENEQSQKSAKQKQTDLEPGEPDIEDLPVKPDKDTSAVQEPDIKELIPTAVKKEPKSPPAVKADSAKKKVISSTVSVPAPLKSKEEEETKTGTLTDKKEETGRPVQKEISIQSDTPAKQPLIISRSMSMENKQYVDVIYPGIGWVYLGETDPQGAPGNSLLAFDNRQQYNQNTLFTLHSHTPGTTILHFYKNDPLTENYIDDYLKVTVENKTADTFDHVTAPSYADAVPVKPDKSKAEIFTEPAATGVTQNSVSANGQGLNTAVPSSVNTESQPTTGQEQSATNTDKMSTDEILTVAQKAYDSKDYVQAAAVLNSFFAKAADRIDEGLFLMGQTLEKKSKVQNIKGAIDAYDTIVKNWPASSLWQKANDRSIYLKRFYINIR